MENTSTSNRIHPLMAVAAASVTIASLVGAAAFAGLLPGSKGSVESVPATAAVQGSAPAELSATAPGAVPAPAANALAAQPVAAQPAAAAPAPAPKQVVHHKTVVHHEYAKPAPVQEAAPQVAQQPAQAPAPAAAPQNSALGIGIGAVVGGLVGNQVGGGKGRTLATVAGAIGGGYLGNEIAKRNQASSAPEQK